MSVMSGPNSTGLVARVQNMIMKPAAEWDVIAPEPASIGGLYTGYACILAAIPPIATILASLLFLHIAILGALIIAVLSYVLALVGVFVVAFIIDILAPNFGAERSQIQALKLVVYAQTAGWVAGIANIIPGVGGLIALVGGLYSLYVLYLGLPKLMKSPADKTTGYFVVSILVAIVVNVLIGVVVGIIFAATAMTAVVAGGAMTGAH